MNTWKLVLLGVFTTLSFGAADAQERGLSVQALRDSREYSRITQDDPACAEAMAQWMVGERGQAGLDSRSEELSAELNDLLLAFNLLSEACDTEDCDAMARRESKSQAFEHLETATELVADQGFNHDYLQEGLAAVRSECGEYGLDLSYEEEIVAHAGEQHALLQEQRAAIRGFAIR